MKFAKIRVAPRLDSGIVVRLFWQGGAGMRRRLEKGNGLKLTRVGAGGHNNT
jgi:hypothetical protein